MFNMQKMMAQVQKIQQKAAKMQEELESERITGSAAGGVVEVIMDGQSKFKSIKLKAEAINPDSPETVDEETIEMLEDLITSAINDASNKSSSIAKEKMDSITGGMKLPPGMGGLGNFM